MTGKERLLAAGASMTALLTLVVAGCGGEGAGQEVAAAPASVPVTVAPATRRTVERTVEAVGTLKGWEDVTIGSKKEGRVRKVFHDMGDRVKPDEPLVQLETEDARLSMLSARSKYLAELAKLGATERQADEALKRFGISEALVAGEEATRLIEQAPTIVQAGVAVEKASNNLNRQRHLHQRGAGTLEELQNVENDYRAAQAARASAVSTARNVIATAVASKVAIDVAEQWLNDMTVRAPVPTVPPELVTGPVTYAVAKRSVGEGQMLRAGDPVLQLVIENPLRLWINVPEQHNAVVKLGQPVRVTVASYPGTTFEGKVARINPAVDAASRTFQVEAVLQNSRGLLRPGGFAKASILTDSKAAATVVPLESVVRYAGVTKVFVVEGGKARAIPVETGLEGEGWVEVIGRIPPSARVVVTGQSKLADDTPVDVRDDTPRPSAAAVPAG